MRRTLKQINTLDISSKFTVVPHAPHCLNSVRLAQRPNVLACTGLCLAKRTCSTLWKRCHRAAPYRHPQACLRKSNMGEFFLLLLLFLLLLYRCARFGQSHNSSLAMRHGTTESATIAMFVTLNESPSFSVFTIWRGHLRTCSSSCFSYLSKNQSHVF